MSDKTGLNSDLSENNKETQSTNEFKGSSSENTIKCKGIKQKIVNRVKSWSGKEKFYTSSVEVDASEAKNFEPETMDEVPDSNLTRAKGSIESLKREESTNASNDNNDGLPSCSTHKTAPASPKSSPTLFKKGGKSSFWEALDKKGKKNRKDSNRKKKKIKNFETAKETTDSVPSEGKSCIATTDKTEDYNIETLEDENTYRYKYFPRNSKSVLFTNEVFVVYFNGDEVLCESKEPLKRDTEQQIRNKEMRQGHLLKAQEKYNLCLY